MSVRASHVARWMIRAASVWVSGTAMATIAVSSLGCNRDAERITQLEKDKADLQKQLIECQKTNLDESAKRRICELSMPMKYGGMPPAPASSGTSAPPPRPDKPCNCAPGDPLCDCL